MGYRISKVYTRTGDGGLTGLATGQRVAKNHPWIQALGAVDELNAHLGLLKAHVASETLTDMLAEIQQQLFNIGGDLALPGGELLRPAAIVALEVQIDRWNAILPPLENFVLPGGSLANAQAHVTRAVARRAERDVAAAQTLDEPVLQNINPQVLAYLNRLADWLFVLARVLDESEETLWRQGSEGHDT